MFYKEATLSSENPPLVGAGLDRFLYEFANLSDYAVSVLNGEVVEEKEVNELTFHSKLYLLGWRWNYRLLNNVSKGRGWPETAFVEFVHEMCIRLGIISYDPTNAESKKEFEIANMNLGYITPVPDMVRTTLDAQITQKYEGWCMAHNRGPINVE